MISRDEAIARARQVADERGWPWQEPIMAARTRRFVVIGRVEWEIRTNADVLGTNVRVVVDGYDGSIIAAGYLAR